MTKKIGDHDEWGVAPTTQEVTKDKITRKGRRNEGACTIRLIAKKGA
jgi:hypothetical protein